MKSGFLIAFYLVAAALLALFAAPRAMAGPFAEFGIGVADGGTCIRDYQGHGVGCSDSPLGYAAIGYRHGRLSLEAEHWSSLHEKDRGLNVLSLKYRIGG